MPPKKAKSGKAKPRVSVYSVYIREELARLKDAHPDMEHRERFRLASMGWAKSPRNPKNR